MNHSHVCSTGTIIHTWEQNNILCDRSLGVPLMNRSHVVLLYCTLTQLAAKQYTLRQIIWSTSYEPLTCCSAVLYTYVASSKSSILCYRSSGVPLVHIFFHNTHIGEKQYALRQVIWSTSYEPFTCCSAVLYTHVASRKVIYFATGHLEYLL